ncbi:MAG: hypothetical protein EA370_15280 [Wenzhouxiangella sp.]|nr:MAG: hypothetical protein EA370_15280 [Wenzhouxiangella sp.]
MLAGKVHSVGIDDLEPLLDLIEAGVVDSSFATRPEMQGSWAVTCLWMARLSRPLPRYIDTDIGYVTRDQLETHTSQ